MQISVLCVATFRNSRSQKSCSRFPFWVQLVYLLLCLFSYNTVPITNFYFYQIRAFRKMLFTYITTEAMLKQVSPNLKILKSEPGKFVENVHGVCNQSFIYSE